VRDCQSRVRIITEVAHVDPVGSCSLRDSRIETVEVPECVTDFVGAAALEKRE